ncbi:hypothetical protein SUNI508_07402 [Seiridium unicorne]|uniref:Signal peptide peptidase n=1 Tax=Seiridium unicorne TaxID=138068 RepID=A0ABR2UY07_9PEZI
MANSTIGDVPAEGLTVTGNLTLFESFTQLPATLWKHQDLFILEAKIVFAALGCIYLGAHASLRRPPSASPPPKKKSKHGVLQKDEDQDEQFVQGLVASDAIMFPVLAGTVLVGLYYLIKWLEDPAIISKIMGVYFSIMSLGSMGKLFADTLHFITGFVFPEVWKGRNSKVYRFDGVKKCQYSLSESDKRVYDETKKTPFPGFLSARSFSEQRRNTFWELRHLFQEQWTIRLGMHGIGKQKFHVRLNDVLGAVTAIGASIFYQTTKSNFLSNIMGYAFSYVGIVTLSPTTFTIGSSVLFGLFFYDIYMVFYTPYMVTVATKLDVPIKLVFESNKRSSMLGLGDIVVPGIFIGLCLRFDHFLYYYRQQKLIPIELESAATSDDGAVVTNTETQRMVRKPKYVSPMGQWGNKFWGKQDATPAVKAAAFPKTYFKASMGGYLLAMVTTLVMLLVFKHAQPALLYLVPGVVSAVWITGAARGEIHEMWIYTEDGSLDKQDVVVEVDGDGNIVNEVADAEKIEEKNKGDKKDNNSPAQEASGIQAGGKTVESSKSTPTTKKSSSRTVFVFSIEAPSLPVEVEAQS